MRERDRGSGNCKEISTTSEEYFLELPANFNIMLPKSSPLQPNNATGIQFTLLPGQTAKATDYLDARPLRLHGFAFWTTKFKTPSRGQLRVPFSPSVSNCPHCGSEVMGMHKSHALKVISTSSVTFWWKFVNVPIWIHTIWTEQVGIKKTTRFWRQLHSQPRHADSLFQDHAQSQKEMIEMKFSVEIKRGNTFFTKDLYRSCHPQSGLTEKHKVKATNHTSQITKTTSSTQMKIAQTLGGSGANQ